MALVDEDEAVEMAIREAEALYALKEKDIQLDQEPQGSQKDGVNAASTSEVESDVARCRYCGILSTDDRVLKDFGISVCFPCKLAHRDDFKCISKSRAMKEYLLTDEQLLHLRSAIVVNPRAIGWKDMKLYLLSQVKSEAMRKWGSLLELEEEKKRRQEAKARQRQSKAKKRHRSIVEPIEEPNSGTSLIEKEIKRQRVAAALINDAKSSPTKQIATKSVAPLPSVFSKRHEHTFGPEMPSQTKSSVYVKRCSECGIEVESEFL